MAENMNRVPSWNPQKLDILWVSFFLMFLLQSAMAAPVSVAIPAFQNQSQNPQMDFLEKTLADALGQALSADTAIHLLERVQLDRQLADQSLVGSDAILKYLGENPGRLILGSYTGDLKEIHVFVKVLDSNGRVLEQSQLKQPLAELLVDLQDLGRKYASQLKGNQAGFLDIDLEPNVAELWIDGQRLGSGDRRAIPLSPGNHQLKIVYKGRSHERRVTLVAGKVDAIRLELPQEPRHYFAWQFMAGAQQSQWKSLEASPGLEGGIGLGYSGPYVSFMGSFGIGGMNLQDAFAIPYGEQESEWFATQIKWGFLTRLTLPQRISPMIEGSIDWSNWSMGRDSVSKAWGEDLPNWSDVGMLSSTLGLGLKWQIHEHFALMPGVYWEKSFDSHKLGEIQEITLFPLADGTQVKSQISEESPEKWMLRIIAEWRI
jgi:hypothetical protein